MQGIYKAQDPHHLAYVSFGGMFVFIHEICSMLTSFCLFFKLFMTVKHMTIWSSVKVLECVVWSLSFQS